MSQAPTELVLLNFEHNLEAALKRLLVAKGLPVFITTDNATLPDSHIEVSVTVNEAAEQGYDNVAGLEWTTYNANLQVQIQTDRKADAVLTAHELASRHNEWKAKVRQTLLIRNLGDWGDSSKGNLKYYEVVMIKPEGTPRQIISNEKKAIEVSTLTYRILFTYDKDALPALA
jgi:hypothetical protein